MRNGEVIKQVTKLKYLVVIITSGCKDITEIKRRIASAKITFHSMRSILSNSWLSLSASLQINKTCVLSTLLRAYKSWTLDAQCGKHLEAFEICIYSGILKIPWTEKITDSKVLEKIGNGRGLLVDLRIRQMRFFSHLWRQNGVEK